MFSAMVWRSTDIPEDVWRGIEEAEDGRTVDMKTALTAHVPWPVLVISLFAIIVAVSSVSYFLIERPLSRLRFAFASPPPEPATCIA